MESLSVSIPQWAAPSNPQTDGPITLEMRDFANAKEIVDQALRLFGLLPNLLVLEAQSTPWLVSNNRVRCG
jgi:hypothetical protein